MSSGQILVVPACEPGRGGGHLCRCITLTGDLRTAGKEAWLFTGTDNADENTTSLFKSMNFNPAWRIKEDGLDRVCAKKIECIILDRFQTPPEELSRWKNIAPVVGIDEGGPCRDSFDFLIDILTPEKFGRPHANIACPSLLKFPKKPLSKKNAEDSLKVLVTFGQEDTAGLGSSVARALSTAGAKNMEIIWLRGSLSKPLSKEENESFPNVRVEQSIPSLAEHLGEYDIVITHYGITAYEALFAGTPVLLASPTAYHKKLAKTAGFKIFSSNSKFFDKKKLTELKNHCKALAVRYKLRDGADLSALFCGLSPAVNRRCPVCGANTPTNSVSRFSERTYRRCKNCGVVYMDRTRPAPFEYEKEYFFEAYAKQYGKTYLEDFPNIKAAGIRRVKIIKSLLPKTIAPEKTEAVTPRALLDIGCAYGPFLDAARQEGFSPFGIDPAQDAVRYVKQELKIQAVHGFFPNCQLPSSAPYDAVTLWYVIEHFTDCAAVLSQVKKILKPGGILAFSTPSFSGVSGRKSLGRFLSASPADHWTVWSPSMCKKALAPFGFKVKKITVSGHHPERFPLFGKFAKSKRSPLYRPLLAVSKFFRLGDTFEVYAECI
jgi:2-polyprenyl-3-methyl-5-hydroxy-6-metoxy-1,4-benzoquinol methylase/spore coat polysaccharide biosynthesis predicted glycosyltransferase SpsG